MVTSPLVIQMVWVQTLSKLGISMQLRIVIFMLASDILKLNPMKALLFKFIPKKRFDVMIRQGQKNFTLECL